MTVTVHATTAAVTINAPTGTKFGNLNGSHQNHFAHQALMNDWQAIARAAIRAAKMPRIDPPVVITVYVHRTTNAKSDSPNVMPTIKAAIDALVKEGVIPDDHDGIVEATVIRRGDKHPTPGLTLNVQAA